MLGKGEKARDENFRKRGKAINEKVGLYATVGKALIAARETGEDPYMVIEDAVGWERFVESIEEAEELALPARPSTTSITSKVSTGDSGAMHLPYSKPSSSPPPHRPSPCWRP